MTREVGAPRRGFSVALCAGRIEMRMLRRGCESRAIFFASVVRRIVVIRVPSDRGSIFVQIVQMVIGAQLTN